MHFFQPTRNVPPSAALLTFYTRFKMTAPGFPLKHSPLSSFSPVVRGTEGSQPHTNPIHFNMGGF